MAALLTALAVLAGCTGAPRDAAPTPAPAPPPVPPAACAVDPGALAAETGVAWTVDATTASDTRCVYTADDRALLTVALGTGDDAGVGLGDLPAVCGGPVTPVPTAGEGAFACALPDGGVFAARRTDTVVATVTASAVPHGTTAEALLAAVADQLPRVGA
jgi:hypothetical protein